MMVFSHHALYFAYRVSADTLHTHLALVGIALALLSGSRARGREWVDRCSFLVAVRRGGEAGETEKEKQTRHVQ
jgi:hypothetical protein